MASGNMVFIIGILCLLPSCNNTPRQQARSVPTVMGQARHERICHLKLFEKESPVVADVLFSLFLKLLLLLIWAKGANYIKLSNEIQETRTRKLGRQFIAFLYNNKGNTQ